MPPASTRADGGLAHRLVRSLSGAASDGEAIDAVLREVGHALSARFGALWLLDEETGLLRWGQDWGEDEAVDELRRVARRLTFASGVGLPGRVLATGEPAWVPDIESDPAFPRAALATRAGLRSAVAAPLAFGGEGVTGVLEFLASAPAGPSGELVQETVMAGRQLAAYLRRSDVEDRLRASEESSASIVRAALDCIITMDHSGRVLDFNPAAEATFGYAREAVVGRRLADAIIPPEYREAHERALTTYVHDGRPTILGQRLELTGMRADGSMFPVELTVTRLGTREPPIFAGFIRDITERRELEEEQQRLLRSALVARAQAEAARVRTDDAREEAERARADAERARERFAVLARAGREMAEGSMEWDATVRAVVHSAVPAVADAATITMVDGGGRLSVVALAHADPEQERLLRRLGDRHPRALADLTGAARAIAADRLALADDVAVDVDVDADADADGAGAEQRELVSRLDVRHRVSAPLRTRAGVIGALTFMTREDRRFSDDDLDLVASLTARAALHLQSARLYRERSHIAQTLQASLRPRALPSIPGVELAARFRPAGDQNEVGGDYYDVFRSGDGVWTAIVGDVAGKGAEAAAITALARHTLRTASMLHDEPAANLAMLDRALHTDSDIIRFCTAFYARLCPTGGGIDVRFANGGHPGPVLLRADGSVATVESGRGPLLGAIGEASFAEDSLRLEEGELLLIYTDGVTEVRTTDLGFGERELLATVAAHAGGSAEDIVAAVERRAVEVQAGEPRDDIALVAIRARAGA